MNTYMQFLGFFSALLTTISFVPQVYRIWKTNDTGSISLYMFVLFCIGVLGWLVYGILREDNAVVFANAATFLMSFYILVKKLKNGGS